MKPIEIYKELPKSNCSDCNEKTCMAFAIGVSKGDLKIANCPHLDNEKAQRIAANIVTVDWRLNIIKSLWEDIKDVDLHGIAAALGAAAHDTGITIRSLGRDFIVGSDRKITSDGQVTPWEEILLLLYIKTGGKGEPAMRWVSFSELRGGGVKVEAIRKEFEEPMSELFNKNPKQAIAAIESLGAELVSGQASEMAWRCHLMPKIPMLALYWPADTEFPARFKAVFDASADMFLDVESIVFLCEGFVKRIAQRMGLEVE
ncbi:MAG: DUF3786 domain-containing protein [Candidatus Magnetominusculus sp. LBB02]|nr:DUF3786 domain-containing protein [Candidatus Magnetominusculus sp. LBB02]